MMQLVLCERELAGIADYSDRDGVEGVIGDNVVIIIDPARVLVLLHVDPILI